MAGRRLDADEQALWRRVTAGVRPLVAPARPRAIAAPPVETVVVPDPPKPGRQASPPPSPVSQLPAAKRPVPGATLDGGWDRRLSRGVVSPDRTIDLHGHTLAGAYGALDHALDRALSDGARLVLVVTGRPPRPESRGMGQPPRGAIRAGIGDWLAGSRHAGRIAAVRNAHPRHGGAGALYVVLRRNRTG